LRPDRGCGAAEGLRPGVVSRSVDRVLAPGRKLEGGVGRKHESDSYQAASEAPAYGSVDYLLRVVGPVAEALLDLLLSLHVNGPYHVMVRLHEHEKSPFGG
jgi:hypothetical protein